MAAPRPISAAITTTMPVRELTVGQSPERSERKGHGPTHAAPSGSRVQSASSAKATGQPTHAAPSGSRVQSAARVNPVRGSGLGLGVNP